MDAILILLLLAVLVAVVAYKAGGWTAWAREEWRLAREKNWQATYLINPRLGSISEDRVALMICKQRAMGKRMRKQGRSLLARGKAYTPVMTKPAAAPDAPPPRADKVVPIRKTA